jgi:GDP-4-dehydro-6-deoxy-D-mannose reductase
VAARKILITGASGFIGSRLTELLRAQGDEVVGPSLQELEFTKPETIKVQVQRATWDCVVHLAAVSNVGACERDPDSAYRVNLEGTVMLADEVRRTSPRAHFIFASSAQIYAAPTGEELVGGVVFGEDRQIVPQNVYAWTKWRCELLLGDLARREGFKITNLRFFNHTHRTQATEFFLPHLYSVMSKAERGKRVRIPVGNLDVQRDIGALDDLARAVVAVINRGGPAQSREPDVFNICSGMAKNLGSLASKMASRLGVDAEFVVDPARVRAGEAKSIEGSHQKLTAAVGWQPKSRTEDELLEYFLNG